MPNAAHQQAHTSSEPKYEARPKTLMGTLLAGAGVGMLITRVMFPGFGEMIVGGMAGAAATSLCYATGVCLLACHRRENGLDAPQAQKEIMVVVTSSNSEERDEEIV